MILAVIGADKLVITTPYFVPDEGVQSRRCASARRGVRISVVFPARNDSWMVAVARRSYYRDLLDAGVWIFAFHGGLVRARCLTLDGEVTLIGSANMDRRSFDLDYENNILFRDRALTAEVRARQERYMAQSTPIIGAMVAQWSWRPCLWNNTVAMLGPVL